MTAIYLNTPLYGGLSNLSCKSYSRTWNSLSANSITDTYTCVFSAQVLTVDSCSCSVGLSRGAEEQRRRPPFPGGEQEQWHSETAQRVHLYEKDTQLFHRGERGEASLRQSHGVPLHIPTHPYLRDRVPVQRDVRSCLDPSDDPQPFAKTSNFPSNSDDKPAPVCSRCYT